jgi:hypothetical protein
VNPTDIDELLHQHGRRWIESQPPPPSLEAAVRHTRGASRPRIRYLAIAACVIAVLAVAAVPLARTLGDRHDATRPAGPSGQTLAKLSQIARSSGTASGDSQVTAEAVQTTYLAAERAVLDGDTSSDPAATTPVWVVQIHGDFVCNLCTGPPGAAAPTGHVITLILVATTLKSIDFSLGNNPHDLARLGSVITLIR